MNLRLVFYLLGLITLLIGGAMAFSLPWAFVQDSYEWKGFFGLFTSVILCLLSGGGLIGWGFSSRMDTLYRKEAMAVVGLSWVLATILGALPFLLSGTCRDAVRDESGEIVRDTQGGIPMENRIPMNMADALFESQSGFSTTGATVLTAIAEPQLVPRCILFWRSSTHFLGGLGIMVLFVAILGQGSAGKALMRNEMPGPTKETGHARTQDAAWKFAFIYAGMNAVLTGILWLEGMTLFDASCHAFGTMATGGFSTYDASLGHFDANPWIDSTVLLFMFIAGMNFTLVYWFLIGQPMIMLKDTEWRGYVAILLLASIGVIFFGYTRGDFKEEGLLGAIRYGTFQVVSVMTTTGFGTHDFDSWNSFGRGLLFLLMFVGGCAGSTGGGIKVIRHLLFFKILWLEIEKAFHPSVVRPLRISGKPVEDQQLRHHILVYFSLVLAIFVMSWLLLVTVEPSTTWTAKEDPLQNKLIDCATAVSATLNNIGPGLGTIGATRNYAHFSWWGKLIFTWLMMLGRLELFVMLVLFVPAFWRNQM
ncbi:Trk system potassium uptake protein TrkH [Planctomycetales bacterium 10988]|nr:Trk system potassium uptake protein TrkH [Planctomycetales bacterium 10988]